jgi:hypothetical protein
MRFLILLVICLVPLGVFAQQESVSTQGDTANRISIETDGVWHEWQKIDSAWMHGEYGAILQKFKLHMSCAHCEDILMHVEMMIDSSGKLTSHHMLRSDKCGQEFDKKLEGAFMQFFYGITFPAIFRRSIFTVMLGTGLKC